MSSAFEIILDEWKQKSQNAPVSTSAFTNLLHLLAINCSIHSFLQEKPEPTDAKKACYWLFLFFAIVFLTLYPLTFLYIFVFILMWYYLALMSSAIATNCLGNWSLIYFTLVILENSIHFLFVDEFVEMVKFFWKTME